MAARDCRLRERLLQRAGLPGWEAESAAAARESSKAGAAKGFLSFCGWRVPGDVTVDLPHLPFSLAFFLKFCFPETVVCVISGNRSSFLSFFLGCALLCCAKLSDGPFLRAWFPFAFS